MKNSFRYRNPAQRVFLLSGLFLLGVTQGACGNSNYPVNSAECPTGSALILVYPNMLQVGCGCTEAEGTTADLDTNLDCTVAAGTIVSWHYLGTDPLEEAQIIPEGSPTFPTSTVLRGGSDEFAHSVPFDTATQTYQYFDGYNPSLRGRIIVP